MTRRVVVVLGYSDGGRNELHPVCAARLERAAEIACPTDVVVLSGWARVHRTASEAELMRDAWAGDAERLVVDPDARTTMENAWNAMDDIRAARADEVVVVTSRWHAPRARAAFRLALRCAGAPASVRVRTAWPRGDLLRVAPVAREAALYGLLPLQARALRDNRRQV